MLNAADPQYYKALADNFRGQGERVDVYLGAVDYQAERAALLQVVPRLEANPAANIRPGSAQFWYPAFIQWVDTQVCLTSNVLYCVQLYTAGEQQWQLAAAGG